MSIMEVSEICIMNLKSQRAATIKSILLKIQAQLEIYHPKIWANQPSLSIRTDLHTLKPNRKKVLFRFWTKESHQNKLRTMWKYLQARLWSYKRDKPLLIIWKESLSCFNQTLSSHPGIGTTTLPRIKDIWRGRELKRKVKTKNHSTIRLTDYLMRLLVKTLTWFPNWRNQLLVGP